MKNWRFMIWPLLISSLFIAFEPLLVGAQEPSSNDNGTGIVSFFNYIGWILGFIFYSWFTPFLVIYLVWRFWPEIVIFYRKKITSKNQAPVQIDSKPAEIPDVTFNDVILPKETLLEVSEIVDFLKNPEDIKSFGFRLPKGVLLSGLPGCGKTLLARAIAGEAQVRFYAYCGSDFVKFFVGAGAATVRERFSEARKNTPCIVFIDELDSLGRQRESGISSQEYELALNQLLSEIDGFIKTPRLVFLGATNREDLLDPALLRSGRLDRKIIIDLPDLKVREAILKLHAKNKPLDAGIDLSIIAKYTPGFSGSDLENLLNEAAILAYRRYKNSFHLSPTTDLVGKEKIDLADIEEARRKVIAGFDRRSAYVSDEERSIVAFHEAGHTLVLKKIPGLKPEVDIVSIIPRGKALGVTIQLPQSDQRLFSKEYILNQISVACGGRLAEEIKFGPMKITTGAREDIERANDLAKRMVCEWGMSDLGPVVFKKTDINWGQPQTSERQAKDIDREVRNIIKERLEVARVILEKDRLHLELLAGALLAKEVLTGAEVDALLEK